MNQRANATRRFYGYAISLAMACSIVIGCKMEQKTWIDDMFSEMERAWVEADEAGLQHDGRVAAVTAVAHKYFPHGMPKEDAFRLFDDLKERGFRITEVNHYGGRVWPDGELNPYRDEQRRMRMQSSIPPGASRITARNDEYGRVRVIISKGSAITIEINDSGYVSYVRASIWLRSI